MIYEDTVEPAKNVIEIDKENNSYTLLFNTEDTVKITLNMNDLTYRSEVGNLNIFDNTNYSLGIKDDGAGILQTIHIKNELAPYYYEYKYELSDDVIMDLDEDGWISFYKNNQVIGKMLGPWAKDNTGQNMETHYIFKENNRIIQYINHDNAQFPIIADPYTCSKYFSSHTLKKKSSYPGRFKKDWNLEPDRANSSYPWVVMNLCNP